MYERSYLVKGMSCAACAAQIEKRLLGLSGVQKVSINLSTEQAFVAFDPANTSDQQIIQVVKELGYSFENHEEYNPELYFKRLENHLKKSAIRFIAALAATLTMLMVMWLSPLAAHHQKWLLLILSSAIVFVAGGPFFRKAFMLAKKGQSNMDTLIALGTGSAYVFSLISTFMPDFIALSGQKAPVFFEASAMIISIVLLGRYLEERARFKTIYSLRELIGSQKLFALKKVGEHWEKIRTDMLEEDDVVRVRAGEQIPVDGEIIEGSAEVDESLLSGESLPVFKKTADYVLSGSLATNGYLLISVKKAGRETYYARMQQGIRHALEGKSPAQRLADRISAVFVPSVIGVASLAALIWGIFGPAPSGIIALQVWFNTLIISCPCALGLATPAVVAIALGKAARQGILIKEINGLENLYKTRYWFFDKTGTLTQAKPKIVSLKWFEETELNQYILSRLASSSSHPYSKAIYESLSANEPNPTDTDLKRIKEIPGRGIQAKHKGASYQLGKPVPNESDGGEEHAYSRVDFLREQKILASFYLEDPLKPEVRQIIDFLHAKGIKTSLLSGDRHAAVSKVAKDTGIGNFYSNMTPDSKKAFIQKMTSRKQHTCMVGDGVNDAPALSMATVGIAMGNGTAVAVEAADISLLNGNPKLLIRAFNLSKFSHQLIRQNLFWAFFYNVLAIPLAAGVFYPFTGQLLNPVIAGIAMSASSLMVVFNSLRLLVKKL